MIDPAPELPDNTLIESVRLPQRIRNLLNSAGLKTVGEVRDKADAEFLSLPSVDKNSLQYLRRPSGFRRHRELAASHRSCETAM
ncbi:DNA-directed RNA polymerase subunit alpha C-terminal domain-containing protein, partial [Vibrio parahaemolyticus]